MAKPHPTFVPGAPVSASEAVTAPLALNVDAVHAGRHLWRWAPRVVVLGLLAGLTACGATEEINFTAGDNTMSFEQDAQGRYVRTDAAILGDLSDVLPEGVVPVGSIRSAQGESAVELAAAQSGDVSGADAEGSRGGGLGFGNFTFRTARSAELQAEREADETRGDASASRERSPDAEQPGLLMRLLGLGGNIASETLGIDEVKLGEDGLPVDNLASVGQVSVSVNPFLWDATAQTLAFMPLSQTDLRNGLYATDWYTGTQTRPERVRVDVQHTSDVLGPGSFHVTVHRQIQEQGIWREAPSSLPAARELEGQILRAAQQLKTRLN